MVFNLLRRSSDRSRWLYNAGDASFEPLSPDETTEFKPNRLEVDSTDLERQTWSFLRNNNNNTGFKIDARVISDAIIGLSDGLTVPFALTAGMSSLEDIQTKTVIYAGLAELIAGAISMGLGGYLGARSEKESYDATMTQTRSQILQTPETIPSTISNIFDDYDIPQPIIDSLTVHLAKSPKLVDFLMVFEHNSPEPAGSRAVTCAMTIAAGYFVGGFIPLLPYIFVPRDRVLMGLIWSIGVMVVALFVFGYVKTCFVCGWNGRKNVVKGLVGAGQMVVVGSTAAGAAMGLVRLFDHLSR